MVVQLFEGPSLTPEPRGRKVRALLDRAGAFPELAVKYRHLGQGATPVELRGIAPLEAAELRAAVWSGVRAGLLQSDSMALYLGGGTTSQPSATVVPTDMFIPEIVRDWQPLGRRDVLLNLCRGSRLWPAHDMINSLAKQCRSSVIPFGGAQGDDLSQWLEFLSRCGATALAADTPTIRQLVQLCLRTGRSMDFLRTVIWVGSGLDTFSAALLSRVCPDARVWTLYGSVDTWAVGGSGPECARGIFHPFPHQYIEIVDDEILVTTLHERAIAPVLRYRSGDTGEFTTCPCGSPASALRVSGRLEDVLNFRGARFSRVELADLARTLEEVRDAEAVVLDLGLPAERLQLRVELKEGIIADRYQSEWVRQCMLGNHLTLGRIAAEAPEAIEVITVANCRLPQAAH